MYYNLLSIGCKNNNKNNNSLGTNNFNNIILTYILHKILFYNKIYHLQKSYINNNNLITT